MKWLLLGISLFLLSGCSDYGAHQHYIISHDQIQETEPVR